MKKHKVLIAKDNQGYCQELGSYLGKMAVFDVMPFAYDGYETIERIAINKPDLLLIDAVLPKLDGVGVLKKLNAMGLSKGMRIIALSPFADDDLVKQLEELGALYVIYLPAVPQQVFSRIVDFAIQDDDGAKRISRDNRREEMKNLRDKVIANYFYSMSAPVNLAGYQQAKAAVAYCVDNYDRQSYVTKDVYPYVAELYDSTAKRVERNIRTFIEAAWERGDIEKLNKLFGYTVSQHKGRPTNKEFIALMTERAIMRMRQG